jgi:hypothetical protein
VADSVVPTIIKQLKRGELAPTDVAGESLADATGPRALARNLFGAGRPDPRTRAPTEFVRALDSQSLRRTTDSTIQLMWKEPKALDAAKAEIRDRLADAGFDANVEKTTRLRRPNNYLYGEEPVLAVTVERAPGSHHPEIEEREKSYLATMEACEAMRKQLVVAEVARVVSDVKTALQSGQYAVHGYGTAASADQYLIRIPRIRSPSLDLEFGNEVETKVKEALAKDRYQIVNSHDTLTSWIIELGYTPPESKDSQAAT